jgi:hypothetical protein
VDIFIKSGSPVPFVYANFSAAAREPEIAGLDLRLSETEVKAEVEGSNL